MRIQNSLIVEIISRGSHIKCDAAIVSMPKKNPAPKLFNQEFFRLQNRVAVVDDSLNIPILVWSRDFGAFLPLDQIAPLMTEFEIMNPSIFVFRRGITTTPLPLMFRSEYPQWLFETQSHKISWETIRTQAF